MLQQKIQSWLSGRCSATPDGLLQFSEPRQTALSEKLRHAYAWITEHAIYTPCGDMEFGPALRVGRDAARMELHKESCYASFILLPLLNLVVCRRMVFVGAPGRGKTTAATLMGLLAGGSFEDVRRAVQHGHPQLTLADLLGSPLPGALTRAQKAEEISVHWRQWISRRVKIIDEYNRIPTKTQSALLSLMAEGYAELFEQVIQSPPSAWYLTANDDQGGGTFPVIEALRDRIDIVVRCTPFHGQFLEKLAQRLESNSAADEAVPRELIFSGEELEAIGRDVAAVAVSNEALSILSFLLGQLDFCRMASDRLEHMTKDTLHLAGRRVGQVCTEDCPLDKAEHLCTQTERGVSARAYQAILHFAKALAFFRGRAEVTAEDFRQILPWALHDKMLPNPQSAFFQKVENRHLLLDRAGWIRQLFDRALAQQAAYAPVRKTVLALKAEADAASPSLSGTEIQSRQAKIQKAAEDLLAKHELSGPLQEDLLLLKHLHGRYQSLSMQPQSGRRRHG